MHLADVHVLVLKTEYASEKIYQNKRELKKTHRTSGSPLGSLTIEREGVDSEIFLDQIAAAIQKSQKPGIKTDVRSMKYTPDIETEGKMPGWFTLEYKGALPEIPEDLQRRLKIVKIIT